jgi:hypothetical protein
MFASPLPALTLAALISLVALQANDATAGAAPTYSIDFHTISAGATQLRNACFHLAGTLAQIAPGYSATTSGPPIYTVYAGFWAATSAMGSDAIFFTGFEAC